MLEEMFNIVNQSQQKQTVADIVLERKKRLLQEIAKEHDQQGVVLFFAPIEQMHQRFIQDSTFYYFSSMQEAGVILQYDETCFTTLYRPHYPTSRAQWVATEQLPNSHQKHEFGIDSIQPLGAELGSYQMYPYVSEEVYQNFLSICKDFVRQGKKIFTTYPKHPYHYAGSRFVIDRLIAFLPELRNHIVDISACISRVRRKKDFFEIEQLYQAIDITKTGFMAAARVLQPGVNEAELQAAIEYIFTEHHAIPAYPSIIAGGERATILHYDINNQPLQKNELVLIDAGARYNYYCADITRVYPVSGKFTKKQQKLYEIVLEVQQYISELVRPGMWLSNPQEQDMSLQHLTLAYLKKYGYDQYFTHGIGHFLGLDVHDVGSRSDALQAGDIITIEPGIYIPEEKIGIRIEDNYWVIDSANPVCLSEDIPKTVSEIESLVQEVF